MRKLHLSTTNCVSFSKMYLRPCPTQFWPQPSHMQRSHPGAARALIRPHIGKPTPKLTKRWRQKGDEKGACMHATIWTLVSPLLRRMSIYGWASRQLGQLGQLGKVASTDSLALGIQCPCDICCILHRTSEQCISSL